MTEKLKQNIYFTLMAESHNEADAIREAHDLAEHTGCPMGVTVRHCGSQEKVATVLPNGTVAWPKEKGEG